MELGIRGKVALVGASSQGLGRAVARELAAEGASVVLCARGAEALASARDAIALETGAAVHAVAADLSRDGEPGQNYLCPGLELFFTHTGPTFSVMAKLFKKGRPPAEVMSWVAAEDAKRGPYQPCPCGSGKKFRFCHGDKAPRSPFSRLGEPAAASRAASGSSVHAGAAAAMAGGTQGATE